MARSDAAYSILQLGDDCITHVALTPVGQRFRVEALDTEDLGSPLTSAALARFVETRGVRRDAIYSIIPRHETTARIVTLPARDDREIASMIALTASEYSPAAPESQFFSHARLSDLPSGDSRVLVAAIPRETLERHLALLAGAGLEPRDVYLSTICLHAALAQSPGDHTERSAFAHAGARSLEVLVTDNGLPRFTRGVAHATPLTLDTAESREFLAYETRDALAACRRECEDGLGADQVYTSGDIARAEDIAAFLGELLEKSCAPVLDIGSMIENPADLAGRLPLAALGAACMAAGRAPVSLSLLPASVTRDRALRGVQRRALRLAGAAGIVLVVLAAWFAQAWIQRALLVRELRQQYESQAPEAGDIAVKLERLQVIARQVEGEATFLELLSAVAQAAPPSDFTITRVDYNRDQGLDIWGRARSKDLVLGEFLGSLRALGEGGMALLARAHSQYETAIQERNEAVLSYHVTIPVPQEGTRNAAPR
ncbi:MAG: hypothetical protein KF886_18335 [Candidatus Hydrogenedentes bacterium]|nr:hypothetical protein [Candidatus Hydrogenedentota bacterium]